jgi:biopolymer transport protein ExbD
MAELARRIVGDCTAHIQQAGGIRHRYPHERLTLGSGHEPVVTERFQQDVSFSGPSEGGDNGSHPTGVVRDEHHADDRRAAGPAVIFMAALPFDQRGIGLTLPPPAKPPVRPPITAIVLEMNAGRELAINQHPVHMSDLAARLHDIFDGRREKTLYLSAAAALPYEQVMAVIDTAKGAGVSRVGIVTERMRGVATR